MSSMSAAPLRGQEVFNWLHRLELSHHFDKFIDNGFEELAYCRRIGESDLQAIGITDIHERLALLQAIRLLHVNALTGRSLSSTSWRGQSQGQTQGQGHTGIREEIELQVFKNKSRVLFYNNNAYLNPKYKDRNCLGVEEDNGDYSECAEFDLTRSGVGGGSGSGLCANCYCDRDGSGNGASGVGVCMCYAGEEPFYESVLLPPLQQMPLSCSSNNSSTHVGSGNPNYGIPPPVRLPPGGFISRDNFLSQQHQVQRDLTLRSQLRDQVMQDGINFSRIPDEMALRAVAAKYATEWSSGNGGGGGTSFSSTSSSSSGYPSSLTLGSTNSSLQSQSHGVSNKGSSSWIREGLPLLEFQNQVLQQLREIWLEERRKLLNGNTRPSTSSVLMSPLTSSTAFHENQGGQRRGLSSSTSGTGDCYPPNNNLILSSSHPFLIHNNMTTNNTTGESPTTTSNNVINPSSGFMLEHQGVGPGSSNNSPLHLSNSGHSDCKEQQQKTPFRHEYLQNVILSANNPSTCNNHPLTEANRQTYTPGIYLPSSCLRDRDDIYDYVPPRVKCPQDDEKEDDETRSPIPHTSKQRGGTLGRMSRYQQLQKGSKTFGRDGHKTYGFLRAGSSVTSPRKNGSSVANNRFSTLRVTRNSSSSGTTIGGGVGGSGPLPPPTSSISSFTISGSCSSSSNSNSSTSNTYGFVSGFPHLTYSGGNAEETVGCRTLVNLHKLGRRLGLTRFFRTLRIQNADGSGETTHRQYLNSTGSSSSTTSSSGGNPPNVNGGSSSLLFGLSPCSAETLGRLRRFQSESARFSPTNNIFNENENQTINKELINDSKETSHSTLALSSLPSNERIIETINRLKYEELQRRKERIAQEHQMMLKELKGSMSMSIPGSNSDTGPSSIFYVSNTENEIGAEDEDDIKRGPAGGPSTTSDYFEDEERDEVTDGESNTNSNQNTYEEPFDTVQNLAQTQNPKGISNRRKKSSSSSKKNQKLGSSLPNFPDGEEQEVEQIVIRKETPGTTTTKNLAICSTSDQNLNEGESSSGSGSGGGSGSSKSNPLELEREGDEEYQEHFKSLGSNVHLNSKRSFKSSSTTPSAYNPNASNLANEPGQRSSYASTASRTSSSSESFSEIFARHLRSRLTTKSAANNQTTDKNGSSEELSRRSTGNRSSQGSSGDVGCGSPSRNTSFLGRVLGAQQTNSVSTSATNRRQRGSKASVNGSSSPQHSFRQECEDVQDEEWRGEKSYGNGESRGVGPFLLEEGEGGSAGGTNSRFTSNNRKKVESFGNSSEEELTSINSLSINDTLPITSGYNGPFDGRAIALVDSTPSPYDRYALRYKKGEIIEIISKKATGLWMGKVNNQVGHFKFINVQLLPSDSSDVEDEEGSNSHLQNEGDYPNYQTNNGGCSCSSQQGEMKSSQHSSLCSLHNNGRNQTNRQSLQGNNNSLGRRGRGSLSSWDLEERQNIANVMNGELESESPSKRTGSSGSRKETEQDIREDVVDQDGKCHSSNNKSKAKKRNDEDNVDDKTPQTRKKSLKKGRPSSVGDLLHRINLDEHISLFILHGFETLDLFKELEEEDLDRLEILAPTDRAKILTAVELLREYETDSSLSAHGPFYHPHNINNKHGGEDAEEEDYIRPPAQTLYQYQYYTQRTPNKNKDQECVTTAVQVHHHSQPINGGGGKATNSNSGGGGGSFYRFNNHPRDSGIFVGKCEDGEEDLMDDPLTSLRGGVGVRSGPSYTQEDGGESSHPDAETEEIILSPINLEKSSNSTWHHPLHVNSCAQNHQNSRFISGNSSKSSPVNQNSPKIPQRNSTNSNGGGYWPVYSSSSSVGTTNTNTNTSSSHLLQEGPSGIKINSSGGPSSASIDHYTDVRNRFLQAKSLFETHGLPFGKDLMRSSPPGPNNPTHTYDNIDENNIQSANSNAPQEQEQCNSSGGGNSNANNAKFLYCEKSSDSGISVCTNSPPPLRNEYRT